MADSVVAEAPASEFAIEGLWLGVAEEQLIEVLDRELGKLRPREAK